MRAFGRNASEAGLAVRVNDTDFLLIQPGRTPMGALSRSAVVLRETLTHFFGAAEAENIHISLIGDGGLEAPPRHRGPTGQRRRRRVQRSSEIGLSVSLYGVQSGSIALAARSAGVSHLLGDHIIAWWGSDLVAKRVAMMISIGP